jgi:hypothetical protein
MESVGFVFLLCLSSIVDRPTNLTMAGNPHASLAQHGLLLRPCEQALPAFAPMWILESVRVMGTWGVGASCRGRTLAIIGGGFGGQ